MSIQTRRNVLRKGLVVGGIAWATPTITAISMTSANAATPSGQPPHKPPKPSKPPKPPVEPPSTPPAGKTPTPKPTPPATTSPTPTPSAPGSHAAPPPGSELPNTGSDVTNPLALGSITALGGAAVYAASRKLGTTGQDRSAAT